MLHPFVSRTEYGAASDAAASDAAPSVMGASLESSPPS